MVLILVTVALWSTIEVVSKLVQDDIPAMTIAFIRFTAGGLILLPLSLNEIRKRKMKDVNSRDWVSLIFISALGITLTFSLYHKALEWISASSVATLVSMVPIFIAPAGFFLLKERIEPIQVLGLALGGTGIFLIYFAEEPNWRSVIGVLVMVLAVFCFSVYAVLMKRLNRKMTPKVSTPISLFIGGLMMAPIVLFDGAPLFRPMEPIGYVQLGWLSFVAVGLAYLLYFIGLERIKVAKGNSLMYLKPLIAGTLAWIVLNESLTPARIASVILITASIYFVLKGKSFYGRIMGEDRNR